MGLPTRAAVAAALLTASLGAHAAPVTFFGEDLGAGSASGLARSFAAEAAFLAALDVRGTDSLEPWPADGSVSNLLFSGAGVIGMLSAPTLLRAAPFNARFAADGTKYLDTAFNRRISFSRPVDAFGLFVIDANERDNDPAVVTAGGQPLSPQDIDARPFDSVDGIFRIVTERAPGVFELLFDGGRFPAPSGSGLFVGLVDAANPFTNIVLINGTSGLDTAFQDGFAYDRLSVGFVPAGGGTVPEPAAWGLLALAGLGAGLARRQRSGA